MSPVVAPSRPETQSPYVPDMEPALDDDQVPVLQDRTPEWFRMRPSGLLVVLALALTFVVLNLPGLFPQFRLWHTDLWGHLSYGRWIAENRQLPQTEPLLPTAKGVPVIDTAWLSQLIGFEAMNYLGVDGIRVLYTGSIILSLIFVTWAVYRRTESALAALVALAAFGGVSYQLFWVARPQLAGLVCFCATLVIATSRVWPKWYWAAIPVLFALWANLHGSFVMGLVLFGALGVGRAFDVFRRTKSIGMALCDGGFRRLLIAGELALAATFLNPYGWGLHYEVLTFARNANLASLVEWDPLTLRDYPGKAMAVVSLALMWMYRSTPRRITTGEVLAIFGLGLWSLWTARMIAWWAPVAGYYCGLHAGAIWRQWWGRPSKYEPRGSWTVAAFAMAMLLFLFTPTGLLATQLFKQSLGQPAPKVDPKLADLRFRRAVSPVTPILAAKYLKEHPPVGQVFNSYEYGDYLLWAVPNIQLFVDSHVHIIPTEIWEHYVEVVNAGADWKQRLDWYGVNTLVLEVQRQPALIRALKQASDDWKLVFEEQDHTVIYQRKNPL
jgi:hypothetical protein